MKYIGLPRPSYPLALIIKPVGLVSCKWLRKKETPDWCVITDNKD